MKKRIFALLLAGLLLCSMFVACTSGDSGSETTTAADSGKSGQIVTDAPEIVPQYLDRVPADLRFDGQTVTILQRSAFVNELFADSITGDIVNDAIYTRNQKVEDRLGVTLSFVDVEGANMTFNIYHNAITNSINAQDDSYQIIANYAYYGASFCTQGIYMNLNTIEYLDLEQPWWNQDYREEATVNDKLYYIVGDVTTSATERMVVTYVNRDLADQYSSGLDLYAVVDEGKWTLDYQNELIANVYNDLNGNGQIDEADRFGLTLNRRSVPIDALMAAFEITTTRQGADGQIEVALNTEHNLEAIERLQTLFWGTEGVVNVDDVPNGRQKFTAQETIFYYDRLSFASEGLREVEFDYGIMPLPKYSESQESYHTTPHDEYSALSVPVTVGNADMVGAVLEVMGAESYREVRPVIFETAYKVKYLGDEASSKMFDSILDGAVYDFGYIFSNSINNPVHLIRNYVRENQTGLTSRITMNAKVIEKLLNNFTEKFNELP